MRTIEPGRERLNVVERLRAVRHRGASRCRRGQALIEMALVVSILLVLTMGIVQYGLIYNATISLTNVARDGARFAAIHATDGTSDAAIKQHMIDAAKNTPVSLQASNITITPAFGARTPGQKVTVALQYNMTRKMFLPTSFPGLGRFGTAYTTTATMLAERE